MPKRATIIFTSNDGPRQEGPGLFVYYCKYSGKHAFTTGTHAAAQAVLHAQSISIP
jgi:hypothetical protein